MKIAYFDTVAGVSGDMTLGAFLSAGVPFDTLQADISKLRLQGVELETTHIQRYGITAVKLDVIISAADKAGRHLKDIFEIIDRSSLNERIKGNAKKIFMEVAKAEAKIHGSAVEKVHFHEVGALDSIVDIVGAAICLDQLGIEKVYSSPVKLGSGGFAETEHGPLPLPAPATLEILKGYPTVLTDVPFELTTPTGAAIIKAMSTGVLSQEKIIVESVGYGAGTRELSTMPNVLRVMIGELPSVYEEDEMVVIETNIDDMNPEIYPYVIEKLLLSGAQDAYLIPVIMKKGRPGILLSVLSSRKSVDAVLEVIFSQTTTIGVRVQQTNRKKLHREVKEIRTKLGLVKAKAITADGKQRFVPEYEECKRLAEQHNLPLVEIYKILESEFSDQA